MLFGKSRPSLREPIELASEAKTWNSPDVFPPEHIPFGLAEHEEMESNQQENQNGPESFTRAGSKEAISSKRHGRRLRHVDPFMSRVLGCCDDWGIVGS